MRPARGAGPGRCEDRGAQLALERRRLRILLLLLGLGLQLVRKEEGCRLRHARSCGLHLGRAGCGCSRGSEGPSLGGGSGAVADRKEDCACRRGRVILARSILEVHDRGLPGLEACEQQRPHHLVAQADVPLSCRSYDVGGKQSRGGCVDDLLCALAWRQASQREEHLGGLVPVPLAGPVQDTPVVWLLGAAQLRRRGHHQLPPAHRLGQEGLPLPRPCCVGGRLGGSCCQEQQQLPVEALEVQGDPGSLCGRVRLHPEVHVAHAGLIVAVLQHHHHRRR